MKTKVKLDKKLESKHLIGYINAIDRCSPVLDADVSSALRACRWKLKELYCQRDDLCAQGVADTSAIDQQISELSKYDCRSALNSAMPDSVRDAVFQRLDFLSIRPGPKSRKVFAMNTPEFDIASRRFAGEISNQVAIEELQKLRNVEERSCYRCLAEMRPRVISSISFEANLQRLAIRKPSSNHT